MPRELAEWAQDTLLVTFGGLILTGIKQWLEERSASPINPPNTLSKAHAARAMAEEQTQRLLRISNAAVRGSLQFGSLGALFYGVQLMSSIYRGQHDFYNAVHGGMAAGALLGMSCTLFCFVLYFM